MSRRLLLLTMLTGVFVSSVMPVAAQVLSIDEIVQPAAGIAEVYYDDGNLIAAIGEGVNLFSVFFVGPDENIVSFDSDGFSDSDLGFPLELKNREARGRNDSYSSDFSYYDQVSLPAGVFDLGPVLPSGATSSQAFFDDIAMGWESGVFYQSNGDTGDAAKLSVVGDLSPIPDSNPFPEPPPKPDPPPTPDPPSPPVIVDPNLPFAPVYASSIEPAKASEVQAYFDGAELYLSIGSDVNLVTLYTTYDEFAGFDESNFETNYLDPIVSIDGKSVSFLSLGSSLTSGFHRFRPGVSAGLAESGTVHAFFQSPGSTGASVPLKVLANLVIPEPSPLVLLGLFSIVGGLRRRR